MTTEFQGNILKYLIQVREGKTYLGVLDVELFDLGEHKLAFDLIKKYQTRYKSVPSKINLLEFFDKEAKGTKNMTPEIYSKIKETIEILYTPLDKDIEIIKDAVVIEVKRKKLKDLMLRYAGKDLDNNKEFDSMSSETKKIATIGEDAKVIIENSDSGFLIHDQKDINFEIVEGHPTQYLGWNRLTAAGGFHPPQLIVIMAGPKAFKTGLMLNLAQGFVRDGLKVYYADFDNNGVRELTTRFYQSLVGAEFHEMNKPEVKKKLKSIVKDYQTMGGDIRIGQFLSESQNSDDVEMELDRIEEEDNWQPEVIIWDYADKMAPCDSSIKEKRLKIQGVYVDIANVNSKRNVFSFSLSQVKREAIEKFVIKPEDIAEDFAKIANAQAIFAWCRTEEEKKAGYARIIPVVQRQGKPYGTVLFKVSPEIMEIEETSFEEEGTDYPLWETIAELTALEE